MTNLSRRGLLGAIICAPAIVRASSLMAVKVLPEEWCGPKAWLGAETATYPSGYSLTPVRTVVDNQTGRVVGRYLEGDYPLREQFLRRMST